MRREERRLLSELAGLYGVQASYTDVAGWRRRASAEVLLATLRALGAPVEGYGDVPAAIRERRGEGRTLEPVIVAWDGRLRLPMDGAPTGGITVALEQEDGGERSWRVDAGEEAVPPGGGIRLPGRIPLGYHRLRVSVGRRVSESTVVSAPHRARAAPRTWGAFVPLYALHSRRSWGVGDLGDLRALARWISGLGGGLVATTPLNAAFLDRPFEPGPYSPASRLFWNELFLDLGRIPDLEASPEARALVASLGGERRSLRGASLVDHRRAMALKRRLLEPMLRGLLARPSRRREDLMSFVDRHPRLRDYARFRAALEGHGRPWQEWPARQRGGLIRRRDVDPDAYWFHLYAQWLTSGQLSAVDREGRRAGASLCLDLPLGCHPAGYDVWRERDGFALEASTGAPPDRFFAGGQRWGFPPPHPERIREDGYRYLRASLRHVLSRAGVLRLDHIMAFHRLYWIPEGFDPADGGYVRYHQDELYAVLLLEAHRAGAAVVGEDLGTVPAPVRGAMARHGIGRSFVLQTALHGGEVVPPPGAVASLNTHDMPTFESFRSGRDIDRRLADGWLDDVEAAGERNAREAALEELAASLRAGGHLDGRADDRRALVEAALSALGAGPAGLVVAGLEDLWLETEPQNVPGTANGTNWRRRTRHPLERLRRMPEVAGALRALDRARRGGPPRTSTAS